MLRLALLEVAYSITVELELELELEEVLELELELELELLELELELLELELELELEEVLVFGSGVLLETLRMNWRRLRSNGDTANCDSASCFFRMAAILRVDVCDEMAAPWSATCWLAASIAALRVRRRRSAASAPLTSSAWRRFRRRI